MRGPQIRQFPYYIMWAMFKEFGRPEFSDKHILDAQDFTQPLLEQTKTLQWYTVHPMG